MMPRDAVNQWQARFDFTSELSTGRGMIYSASDFFQMSFKPILS